MSGVGDMQMGDCAGDGDVGGVRRGFSRAVVVTLLSMIYTILAFWIVFSRDYSSGNLWLFTTVFLLWTGFWIIGVWSNIFLIRLSLLLRNELDRGEEDGVSFVEKKFGDVWVGHRVGILLSGLVTGSLLLFFASVVPGFPMGDSWMTIFCFLGVLLFFAYLSVGLVLNLSVLYLCLWVRSLLRRAVRSADKGSVRMEFRSIYRRHFGRVVFSGGVTGILLLSTLIMLMSTPDYIESISLGGGVGLDAGYSNEQYVVTVVSVDPTYMNTTDSSAIMIEIRGPGNFLVSPRPITELEDVDGLSYVDTDPLGRISVGDSFTMDEGFFPSKGRYSVILRYPFTVGHNYMGMSATHIDVVWIGL